MNTFIIGSTYFFKDKFNDFESKDIDELNILDRPLNVSDKSVKVLNAKIGNKDIFFYWPLSKEEFIQDTLNSDLPMKVGKFLIKEFAKDYLKMSISDLKRFEKTFEKIDDKHKYEKLIYEYFIENNDWFLTDEQLIKVYNIYKENKQKGS